MNEKFGIRQFALFNSAGFGEMVMPIDGVKQILGSNNVGKTSTISCLKLFFSDSPAKEPQEVWGGYEWEKTRKFYFHNKNGSGSWLVFDLKTEHNGYVTVIFYRESHENTISRMIVRHPFDRSLFVGADGSVARDIGEVRGRLSELGINEPDGIMLANTPEDWRQLMIGNHPHKKAINLGVVPLVTGDAKTFMAFKKTLIRALTNSGFAASELKEAIENAASVSKASFSFADGTHYETLRIAKIDMTQARMALDAKPEFFQFKRDLTTFSMLAGEHHAMAIASITRLTQLETAVIAQLASLNERTVEHGKLIAEKRVAVETANAKHKELSGEAIKLSHAIKLREDELARLDQRVTESMDARTTEQLAAAVEQIQASIGKAGALSSADLDELIERKQQELVRLQGSLALIKQGKLSIEDWVFAEMGQEALSALRQSYCRDALLQPAEMLDKEDLRRALGDKIPDIVVMGPVHIAFKEGLAVAYDKKPDEKDIEAKIAALTVEIKDFTARRADAARLDVMREELTRLSSLLTDKKRIDELRAQQVAKVDQVAKAAELEGLANEADAARRAAEAELSKLESKNLVQEAEQMKETLDAMKLERQLFQNRRNLYDGRRIVTQSTDAVGEIALMDFKSLVDSFRLKEAKVNAAQSVVDTALQGGGMSTFLSRLIKQLQLPSNADGYAAEGNEALRVLEESIGGAEDKLASSATTIKIQIGTAAASLKQILDSLGDVGKRVEAMNREIQSVKLSNLSSISISMQKRDSEIQEILDFIELAKDGNDLLAMDVSLAEKDRIRDAAMRAFESGKTYEASALYSLQFRVESVTGEVELIADSGKTGSEGTRTMFQILSGVILTKSMLKAGFEHKYALNMLVDESLRLDGSNSKELIRFILKSGFTPILANPGIAVDLGVDYEVFLFQKSPKDNLSYVTASKPVLGVRQKSRDAVAEQEIMDAVDAELIAAP